MWGLELSVGLKLYTSVRDPSHGDHLNVSLSQGFCLAMVGQEVGTAGGAERAGWEAGTGSPGSISHTHCILPLFRNFFSRHAFSLFFYPFFLQIHKFRTVLLSGQVLPSIFLAYGMLRTWEGKEGRDNPSLY